MLPCLNFCFGKVWCQTVITHSSLLSSCSDNDIPVYFWIDALRWFVLAALNLALRHTFLYFGSSLILLIRLGAGRGEGLLCCRVMWADHARPSLDLIRIKVAWSLRLDDRITSWERRLTNCFLCSLWAVQTFKHVGQAAISWCTFRSDWVFYGFLLSNILLSISKSSSSLITLVALSKDCNWLTVDFFYWKSAFWVVHWWTLIVKDASLERHNILIALTGTTSGTLGSIEAHISFLAIVRAKALLSTKLHVSVIELLSLLEARVLLKVRGGLAKHVDWMMRWQNLMGPSTRHRFSSCWVLQNFDLALT